MEHERINALVREERLIAIARGVEPGQALPLAEALYAGGVRLLEVTCNTPGAVEMVAQLARQIGDRLLIGAGTVTSQAQCREMIAAGAEYIVAPDVHEPLVTYCVQFDLPIFPGAATPTEILRAKRLGADTVKLFPAACLGPDWVRQLRGPIGDVDLIAVGGITADNAGDFIAAGCQAVGAGGALVRRDLIAAEDWDGITDLARQFVEAVKQPPKEGN